MPLERQPCTSWECLMVVPWSPRMKSEITHILPGCNTKSPIIHALQLAKNGAQSEMRGKVVNQFTPLQETIGGHASTKRFPQEVFNNSNTPHPVSLKFDRLEYALSKLDTAHKFQAAILSIIILFEHTRSKSNSKKCKNIPRKKNHKTWAQAS